MWGCHTLKAPHLEAPHMAMTMMTMMVTTMMMMVMMIIMIIRIMMMLTTLFAIFSDNLYVLQNLCVGPDLKYALTGR